jgi:hypothetical protein
MSNGKNIEIRIAATGADQAAAEVRKVGAATKDLGENPGGTTGFGGMLEAGERIREAREIANTERLKQLAAEKEAVDELARADKLALDEELASMAEKERASREYAAKLNDDAGERASIGRKKEIALAMGAIGVAAGAAARTAGQVKDAFDGIDLVKLRGIEAAMAEQIDTAKNWALALSDPISALLKLTTGETIATAFAGLNEQIDATAKSQAEAIDRMIAKGVVQEAEIRKLAAAIRDANALLDAEAKLAATKRDGEDAAAVRAGKAPEDVAAERAKFDEEQALAAIERRQIEARAGLQEKFSNVGQTQQNREALEKANKKRQDQAVADLAQLQKEFDERKAELQKDGSAKSVVNFTEFEKSNKESQERAKLRISESASPELRAKIDEARAAEKAAKDEFERQKREVAQVDAVANVQRAEVRQGTVNRVAGLGADKADRLKEEADRKAAADQRAADEQARVAERAQRERERDAGRGPDAGKVGLGIEKLIPDGVSADFRASIEKASAALQDGGTAAELSEMATLLAQLGGSTNSAVAGLKSEIAAAKQQIVILQNQLKNR